MIDSDRIGKFILELRKSKNLSQGQLGEILGIDRVSISKWERGVCLPSPEMLLKLSDMFNVTVNEILYGEKKNFDKKNKSFKIRKNWRCLKYFAMGTIFSAFLLVMVNNVYTKDLNVKEDTTNENNTVEVTRGLNQVLINKYGEKITGNEVYDHGALDRDVLEEEMIPGVMYHRYVYDDSLTEEENQEQFIRLEEQAHEEYLKRLLGGKEIHDLADDHIIDKGISTSEGTVSIMK